MKETTSVHSAVELIRSKKGVLKGVLSFYKSSTQLERIKTLLDEKESSGVEIKRVDKKTFLSHFPTPLPEEKRKEPLFLFQWEDSLGGRTEESPAKKRTFHSLQEFLKVERSESVVIILDEISDVHNFGAILRSCEVFGVDLVLHAKVRSATINETVKRTSAGAYAWVSTLAVSNLSQAIRELKKGGYWIYGTSQSGENISQVEFSPKCVLILGSEGKGMRRLTHDMCDFEVTIPMMGEIESLNVSVAAGVSLYEIRRQRSGRSVKSVGKPTSLST